MDHEHGPMPHLTADANLTIMGLDSFLQHGKLCAGPHSGSLSTGTGRVNLVEPVKRIGQRFTRDALTFIRYEWAPPAHGD